MSKPSAPPPPDFAELAKQQGAANKETAITEFSLNNSNQTTPWGSRTLNQTGTDAQGNPTFSIDTTLNAADQANLDKTRSLQGQLLNLAPAAMNNVWDQIGKPMTPQTLPPLVNQVDSGGMQRLDLSSLPQSVTGVEAQPIQSGIESGDAVRNRVEQAMFDKFNSRFQPQAQQQQDQLRTRIANMGGVSDSQGANRMTGQLLASQGDQFNQGTYDSIIKGGEEAERQFGMNRDAGTFYNNAQQQNFDQGVTNANLNNSARVNDANILGQQVTTNNATTQQDIQNAFANANLNNSTRAQGLTEQQTLRQMPLNELMALMSGSQVQQPQFQNPTATNIQPAPIFQAGQSQWNAANQNYQNQAGQWNNTIGTLGKIAGTAATFSDARLKSNVVLVDRTPAGANVYEYDIFGRRERGVMAQELLHTQPDAVSTHPSGFLMVDYSKVQ